MQTTLGGARSWDEWVNHCARLALLTSTEGSQAWYVHTTNSCVPLEINDKTDANSLWSFPQDTKPCPELKHLDLNTNALTSLDLTPFCPRLQHLKLDNNKLVSATGISQLQHLKSLSMRSQSAPCDLTPILSARQPNLNTLCLSENHISTLTMPQDWYSLRTLELASCGLQGLPEEFGMSVPNLRSLNLNFNAIKDLRPLLNIKALQDLHVAGNRLARLRKTTAVLAKLRTLEVLDLRDNPFSLGFHPRAVESRLVPTTTSLIEQGSEGTSTRNKETDVQQDMHFLLPPCDKDADVQYFARLDEGTRLRRRVYEMLLANGCNGLGQLDGLPFSRESVLVRDAVLERLVLLGVVRKSGSGAGKVVDDAEDDEGSAS